MDFSNNSWKSKMDSYFLQRPLLSGNSSTSRLSDFHSKILSRKQSPSPISIPSWKVFRSQIRNNASPPRVEKPRFDHYSDVASFRSNSPRLNGSPLWRNRIRNGSIHSNISGNPSPKSQRPSRVFQIIKIEDLRRAADAINDMDENDISSLPTRYLQELKEFCRAVKDKIKI